MTTEQHNGDAIEQMSQAKGQAPGPKISIGRIVHYTLAAHDAEVINRRRVPLAAPWPSGAMVHVGNSVTEGDEFPLIVTRVWDAEAGLISGQVLLDGSDTLWVASVTPGVGPCNWFWPPRV